MPQTHVPDDGAPFPRTPAHGWHDLHPGLLVRRLDPAIRAGDAMRAGPQFAADARLVGVYRRDIDDDGGRWMREFQPRPEVTAVPVERLCAAAGAVGVPVVEAIVKAFTEQRLRHLDYERV